MQIGSYESMVGGLDPEFSRIVAKRMRGEELTDKELRDIGELPPIPVKKPQRVTPEDQASMKKLIKKTTGYKNGGMIDRAAVRGKTKGKIC